MRSSTPCLSMSILRPAKLDESSESAGNKPILERYVRNVIREVTTRLQELAWRGQAQRTAPGRSSERNPNGAPRGGRPFQSREAIHRRRQGEGPGTGSHAEPLAGPA